MNSELRREPYEAHRLIDGRLPETPSSSPPERQLIGFLGVRCLVVSRDCALAASVNVCVSSAGGLARKGMDDHR